MKSSVHIETALRGDKTILKKQYCSQPFKIADITEDRSQKMLRLMLMSSSPGILDGDEIELSIELEKDCRLQLQTQSYQRLFSMKNGASQCMKVVMQANACFHFLPHPVVPHKLADFSASNRIFLDENCELLWGEVLTCGRFLNGEVYQFSKYQAITEIYVTSKLVIKENLLVIPALIDIKKMGNMEAYTHQASLIYFHEQTRFNSLIDELRNWLGDQPGILAGVTRAPVNGIVVRLLGYKAEQLFNCLKAIGERLTGKSQEVGAGSL